MPSPHRPLPPRDRDRSAETDTYRVGWGRCRRTPPSQARRQPPRVKPGISCSPALPRSTGYRSDAFFGQLLHGNTPTPDLLLVDRLVDEIVEQAVAKRP